MNVQKHYLIKELSTKSGVSVDSIRFYEKKKLLKPSFRADNNYRYYDEEMYKRLVFIKRCRNLDISLTEIQTLLELEQSPTQSCHAVNELIDNHIRQVSEKIKELENFKIQLSKLRASCNETSQINDCQILKHLENGIS
ncbi:Cd(II)/Pb(II)-responsive transcriptional regulator [Acinetobacter sp. ANC 5579]|jgi:Predicted transcriptional regulators|uniref:Cd(II)/Pb(II)-responsive transcriptional regulator n=1 Tax=Acinetobacter TaxID=469 RepID=UPI0015D101D5|nr:MULTISPECIES: Cd(II)/Pb(II)-responsive transcriptional regulator [Acinetobacter]MCL6233539.1 Cd(II)/Pb(II)-responsive transcriptional regulator [Acinetobacter amyesii]MCL6233585.1 Cd(II)/Pb(II)-responsive transcriptional regulator [Acinetobacter amyesii]UUS64287.1 Cd(II)/Pb(II)-responsive transcriptional regulator [Acinetobacter sp. YH12068_T]